MADYLDNDDLLKLDPFVILQLRVKKGLSKRDMEEKLGLTEYQWNKYETEKGTRDIRRVTVSRFRDICRVLEADPLEMCDLMHYWPIPQETIRMFRKACEKEKVTPLEALIQLMKAVIKESDVSRRRDR